MVVHGFTWLVLLGFSWFFMVPGLFYGSRLVFHGNRLVFMVFYGSRLVFMVIHGSRLVFMFPGWFLWFLMVSG